MCVTSRVSSELVIRALPLPRIWDQPQARIWCVPGFTFTVLYPYTGPGERLRYGARRGADIGPGIGSDTGPGEAQILVQRGSDTGLGEAQIRAPAPG